MKKALLFPKALIICLLFGLNTYAQLSVNDFSSHQINFDVNVASVNNGAFSGLGLTSAPTSGQLDSDAWELKGFSNGDVLFGGSGMGTDHARGTSSGSVSTGGFYAFNVGLDGLSAGVQPGGSDFTPGSLGLKIQNNTGSTVKSIVISYTIYEYNDQPRSNSLNFSHSSDNIGYTQEPILDYTSKEAADGVPMWTPDFRSITVVLSSPLADGSFYFLKWNSDDVAGSGSRDQLALDNIDIKMSSCALVASANVNNETCIGRGDGSAQVIPTGGTSGYGYYWDNGESTDHIEFLSGGFYQYTVTDGVSCSVTGSAFIGGPSNISITDFSSQNETCLTYDGEAHVTVSGGSEPYDYYWYDTDNGWNLVGGNDPDVYNISGSNYELQVNDQCSSFDNQIFNIGSDEILVSVSFGITSACGASDGVMNTTVTGGATPYNYAWSNLQSSSSNTDVAGIYFVTVEDVAGCMTLEDGAIVDLGAPMVSLTATNVRCYEDNDGTIFADVTGGTPNYDIFWGQGIDATPIGTGATISGLSPDLYLVTVVDAAGCKSFNGTDVEGPNQLFDPTFDFGGFVNITDVNCNGASDGSAQIQVWDYPGGGGPYNYEWSNGYSDIGTFNQNSSINSLSGGDYEVTITDIEGCVQVRSFEIMEPTALTLTINAQNDDCGEDDGWVMANILGGTPGFYYNWSNGDSQQTLNNLGAGVFSVTANDNNGCYAGTESVTITSTSMLTTSVTTSNANCGANDGTALAFTEGGTTPYSYSWNNGGTSSFVSGLSAGVAIVTIEDVNGCMIFEENFVINPGAPTVTNSFTNVSCLGASDGTLNTTVTGTGPFEYFWHDLFTNELVGTTANVTGLSGGVYLLTVIDAQPTACKASGFVEIEENGPITIFSSINQSQCWDGANFNTFTGSVYVSVYGGSETGYVYDWGSGPTLDDNISGVGEGFVDLTITDADGCSVTESFEVTAVVPETIITVDVQNDLCATGNGSMSASVIGGSGTYNYSWYDENANWLSNSISIENLYAGQQGYIEVYDGNMNCVTNSTFEVITGPINPLDVSITGADAACGDADGEAVVVVMGATPPYTFIWNSGQTASGMTTHTITGLSAGAALVTVYDANTCEQFDGFLINNPGAPSIMIDVNDADCFGGNDGYMSAIVSGGITPYTYNWTSQAGDFVGSSASVTGLMAQTLYLVTVTGDDGCSSAEGDFVGSPNEIEMEIWWQQNPNCTGGSNGMASVNGTGGVGFLSYEWSSGDFGANPSNLTADTNFVTITDTRGCYNVFNIELMSPSAITVSTTAYDANCGSPDGTSMAEAIGGNPGGYNYIWSNGQNNQYATNLLAGNYDVTVQDWNGCEGYATASVNNLNGATVTVTTDNDISCNGEIDGQVTAVVSGGATPYYYTWSDMSTATGLTSTLSGLSDGNWGVTVSDDNGCNAIGLTMVNEPSPLMVNVTFTNPSTIGGSDGTAFALGSGGTATYNYVWSHVETTNSISGLVSGTYTVTVTDASMCSVGYSITLSDPSCDLVVSGSNNSTLCNGSSDGATFVTATSGVTPYVYNWETGSSSANGGDQGIGIYVVTVTDAVGCVQSTEATVTEPALLLLSIAPTGVSCNGLDDGMAIVSITAGTAPYEFYWEDGQSLATATGLLAGDLGVTVTDANGCIVEGATTIVEPAPLVASAGPNKEICVGQSVLIGGSPSASGGGTAYTYLWDNGGDLDNVNKNNPVATASSTVVYTLTVSDGICNDVSSVTVTVNNAPTLVLSLTDALCNGGTDGYASVEAGGTTTPYLYTWSNGSEEFFAVNVGSGSLSVSVEDANACKSNVSGTVGEPAAITLTAGSSNPSGCGVSNGTATAMNTGGSGGTSYIWSNGQTTALTTGLLAGNHGVTFTDVNGCAASAVAALTDPGAPVLSYSSSTSITCNGGNEGDLAFTSTGSPSYKWFDGSNNEISGQTSLSITGLIADAYTIEANEGGCIATSAYTIEEPLAIELLFSSSTLSCASDNDASSTVVASGGTVAGDYIYLWSDMVNTDAVATSLDANVHSITVTDDSNCNAEGSVTISAPVAIAISLTSSNISCNGNTDGSAAALVAGGTGMLSYQWDDLAGSITTNVSNLSGGEISLTVSDQNSCEEIVSVSIIEPTILAISIASNNVNCNLGNDGEVEATVLGGITPYMYNWDDGLSQSTVSAVALMKGIYTVSVTDANGCSIIESITINEPSAITLTMSSTDETNSGDNNGTASVTMAGGNSLYGYLWSNSLETTTSISGLTPGVYSVTVNDNNTCEQVESVTINAGIVLCSITLTSTSTDGTCGNDNGSATVNASGSGSAFTYTWDNGQSIDVIEDLAAMTYYVTVNSNDGCTESTSVTIGGSSGVSADISITDPSCGNSDGEVSVSITAGATPYTYLWEDLNGSTIGSNSSTVTGLSFGAILLTITDNNGCFEASDAALSESGAPTITITSGDVTCNGESDGYLEASISGGTGSFTYTWGIFNDQTSVTTIIDDQTGASLIYLGANADNEMYLVTVTGSDGCSVLEGTSIDQPDAIEVTLTSTSVTSAGALDGTATVSAIGGNNTFTYAWSTAESGMSISGLSGGTYTVTSTDGGGCSRLSTVFVAEDGVVPSCGLSVTLNGTNVTTNGGNDGSVIAEVTGQLGDLTYDWNTGGNEAINSGLTYGEYFITITDDIVAGCSVTASVSISEPAFIYCGVSVTLVATNVTTNGGSNGSVDATVSGEQGSLTYTWSVTGSGESLSNLTAGTYSVTVVDNVTAGCQSLATVTISEPTGVNDLSQEKNVTAFPNPNKGQFTLSIEGSGEYNLSVMNVIGHSIVQDQINVSDKILYNVNLTNVNSGIYFVKIKSNNYEEVIRVVVNK
jgi:hypothetical protein